MRAGAKSFSSNRVLRIVHFEIRPNFEIEGHTRHAEIIVSELGLTSEKNQDTVDTLKNR